MNTEKKQIKDNQNIEKITLQKCYGFGLKIKV